MSLGIEPLEDRRVLTPLTPLINEVYIDPPSSGDSYFEYIELRGEPEASLDGLYLIILENEGAPKGNPGDIDMIFDFSGLEFGENGFLSVRQKNLTPIQYPVNPLATNIKNESLEVRALGFGSTGPGVSNPTTLNVMDDGNHGIMENSGGTFMLISVGAGAVPTLTDDLDADNDGMLDDPNGKAGWTILDSIGVHCEEGEAATGILYGMVNFGPEESTTSLIGPYYGLNYEIEYLGRWGNSTGHTEADWHASNLTDDELSPYDEMGDFRQSGDPHGFGNQTVVETNKDVPYGTILTYTIGGPNYINATVTGRHVFYNESQFDGNNAAITVADNNAIPDKTAYKAGDGLFPVSAMTSYSKGINGIMIDVENLLDADLDLDNFEFRMSNQGVGANGANNAAGSWMLAPDPTAIVVLPDTPVEGTDRIVITWDNNAIKNRYLQVMLKGPDAAGGFSLETGLTESDVFYFGNKVGDTFVNSSAAVFQTSASDEIDIRGHFAGGVDIDNIWDIDHNKISGQGADQIATRGTNFGVMSRLTIPLPAAPQGAPATSGDGSGSAIALALALQTGGVESLVARPEALIERDAAAPGELPPEVSSAALVNGSPVPADLASDEASAVDLALDDELLESLLD